MTLQDTRRIYQTQQSEVEETGQLRDRGAFRIPLPRQTWERVGQPKWGGQVYLTDGFKGANVEDAQGRSFPLKTTLPVPGTSQDVDIQIEAGPGGGKRATQRERCFVSMRSL